MKKGNYIPKEIYEDEKYSTLIPIYGNFDLIKSTDNLYFKTILDIGLGNGGASLYFATKGKKVTSLGWQVDSYNLSIEIKNNKNIEIQEILFENYKTNKKFDAILMSHVLEHTQNVGLFLKKAHSLLNENGFLFIMVPPYKNYIVGGHVTNGWNMGQLIYNLLLSGFDVKNGHFITYGYNICAFVQKSNKKLPNLRMDNGDLELLQDFMPIELKQNSFAKIKSINWFKNFKPINYKYPNLLEEEYKSIVSVYNFCLNLDKNKKYILYGYGSIGKLIYPLIKDFVIGIYDINSLDIPVEKKIQLKDISSSSNVIISPFKYNDEIINILKPLKCFIFTIQ